MNIGFGANKKLVEIIKEGAFLGTYFKYIYKFSKHIQNSNI